MPDKLALIVNWWRKRKLKRTVCFFIYLSVCPALYAVSTQAEDYVATAANYLAKEMGQSATPEQVVSKLSGMVIEINNKGDSQTAFTIAKQTNRYAEKQLGTEHLLTLTSANDLAYMYQVLGFYDSAEPLFKRVLLVREKLLGPEDASTLVSVNNLAVLYSYQSRNFEAKPLFQRALIGRQKVLGEKHPETLTSANNLAFLYQSMGLYSEAEKLFQTTLSAMEQVKGEEHPKTLLSANNLAALYYYQGRYSEAEPLLKRVLVTRERMQGVEHPDTLISVSNLSELYHKQGRYEIAEPLSRRALRSMEKVFGVEHPSTLTSASNLAALYLSKGYYDKAEPLYKRAAEGMEKVLGREHADTLTKINGLAFLYKSQGHYEKAEPLFLRVVEAMKRKLGVEHPFTLTSISNLAELYHKQGRYSEAVPYFQRVLVAREKVLGLQHPDTLASVNNLAFSFRSQGRYGEAELLFQRTVLVMEEVLGTEHPTTLVSIDNLATLYRFQGRYSEAIMLFKKVFEIRERALGVEHPDTLVSISGLAMTHLSFGEYSNAEPLLKRALAVREKVLGMEHPATLVSVNSLATLYSFQGHYIESELLFKQALAMRDKVLGTDHPSTQHSVYGLAESYSFQNRYSDAEMLYQRAFEAMKRGVGAKHPSTLKMQLAFAINQINLGKHSQALQLLEQLEVPLSELGIMRMRNTRQEWVRRLFLLNQAIFQNVVFTLALNHPESRTIELAARVMLHWKRAQEENEVFLARLGRMSNEENIQSTVKEIMLLRREVSRLANLPGSTDEFIEERYRLLRTKHSELELKEVQLAQRSLDFKHHLAVRKASLDDVRRDLPKKSGLLELRYYWPVDFKSGKLEEAHFIALLLTEKGSISLHDIGPAAGVKGLWSKLRQTSSSEIAKALYQQLFGKLHSQLTQFDELYIAPDGFLNLVALGQLVTPDGKYWVEGNTLLRQIQTGRHLIKNNSEEKHEITVRGLVALGDISYESFEDINAQPSNETKSRSSVYTDTMTRSLLSVMESFEELSHTGFEVKEVVNSYWDEWQSIPEVRFGSEASEGYLKSLKTSPRVLHLATHGFYLPNKDSVINRPMVLSGLALAGANRGMKGEVGSDGEDGILYALEAQGLNLGGTELVTLSACETGEGELDYSDGVYGLQRAFRIAGAKNILMSLWDLNDGATQEFMRRFYLNWNFGDDSRDLPRALRKTQLSFIYDENERLRDPKMWAPYLLIEGG